MNKKKELIGKDELNLIEVPFTLLTNRIKNNQKILEFVDKQDNMIRRWKITGSDEYGLPCALDELVYIALLALTKKDGFKNPKIYFNQYELLKIMNWPINSKYYDRLYQAFNRLIGVTIYTDYLWDNREFKKITKKTGFHIINEFSINTGKKNSKSSCFEWSKTIFKSFFTGNIKTLDIETYFSLDTPTSKRFYRLWDKRLYKKNQITFDLAELCHEKLGVSRTIQKPSLLKQALDSTIKEQKEKKLLLLAKYKKDKNKKWFLLIKKNNKEEAEHKENKIEKDSLSKRLIDINILENKAKSLIQKHGRGNIEDWLAVIKIIKPKTRAGFLITALEEKWELPEELRRKKTGKDQKEDEKLMSQYYESIFKQVDVHLKQMDESMMQEELKHHREIFLNKYPRYREFEKKTFLLNPFIEQDYKKSKIEELGLLSFVEWKEQRL